MVNQKKSGGGVKKENKKPRLSKKIEDLESLQLF